MKHPKVDSRPQWQVAMTDLVRVPGWAWEHEVRVALPPSYDDGEASYPTLWVTDNSLETVLPAVEALASTGEIPELIVVSVGAPHGVDSTEWQRRRTFDFSPGRTGTNRLEFAGVQGDYLARRIAERWKTPPELGGAQDFLAFLTDELRSNLSTRFRMDERDHGIAGTSGGGVFVGYAMFARPGAFSRYLCGSPALNNNDEVIFETERDYAATQVDMDADVFLIAGEAEITEPYIADWGIVSSMARLAETLSLRQYPSLRLSARIVPGASHGDIWPVLLRLGLLATWGRDTAAGRAAS